MGNVYWKQENWEEALRWFDKSLAEHRNPDIVTKKNEVISTTYMCTAYSRHYISVDVRRVCGCKVYRSGDVRLGDVTLAG